jgi:hypothetical protein
MQADPAKVDASLTKAQREAVVMFDGQWVAGPTLPDAQLNHIHVLRECELLERNFADEGPARQTVGIDYAQVRLSACWHFRLTPLGLAVREILKGQSDNG